MKKKKEITIKIQPKQIDKELPYPYFIDSKSKVGRQDFWKGKPLKLIAFDKNPNGRIGTLPFSAFWKNPKKAIGMYPVFEHKNKEWYTSIIPITHISIYKGE